MGFHIGVHDGASSPRGCWVSRSMPTRDRLALVVRDALEGHRMSPEDADARAGVPSGTTAALAANGSGLLSRTRTLLDVLRVAPITLPPISSDGSFR